MAAATHFTPGAAADEVIELEVFFLSSLTVLTVGEVTIGLYTQTTLARQHQYRNFILLYLARCEVVTASR